MSFEPLWGDLYHNVVVRAEVYSYERGGIWIVKHTFGKRWEAK